MTAILWLRRDLRRTDHPALQEAASHGDVLPVFIIEDRIWRSAGPVRRGWLAANVIALRDSYGRRLCLRIGEPRDVLFALTQQVGATSVHHTRETTPWAVRRDDHVRAALQRHGVDLIATGTPYAVDPGLVTRKNGDPYKVFTPFSRAWRANAWPAPATHDASYLMQGKDDPAALRMLKEAVRDCPVALPEAGEHAALLRWDEFLTTTIDRYAEDRDRPGIDGTSRLSPYLKVGAIHPRTLLRDLGHRHDAAADRLRTELAWREFYADVLWHHPDSAWRDMAPDANRLYDATVDVDLVQAWQQGRTGYPLVDAGMRQLNETGWMHNRVRMVAASFFTKDLHQWWGHGARYFLEHLLDADLASNNHGWQWVAGTGTDAAPFHRVFNPVRQGQRFDPQGDYVRRWVPELRHLPGAEAHAPWDAPNGYVNGYPTRVVDHATERRDALARYNHLRAAQQPVGALR